jgi:uncharacterized phiE125 gp8 family phage protein
VEDNPAGEASGCALHTLIPLHEFKALLSVDDREDALSRYCLLTATYGIEQYYRRRLLVKTVTEYLDYNGDGLLLLREYPVREIAGVRYSRERRFSLESILLSGQYGLLPEQPLIEDIPYHLVLEASPRLIAGEKCVKAEYRAGYGPEDVPPDLKSACLELAAWNMSRYRGRRIGMTGMVRRKGQDGEHLEASMPENVKGLLEPYRRRMI